MTLSAPQHALEVMVMPSLSHAAAAATLHHYLYSLEYFRRHQWFMASRKFFTSAFHKPEVVAVLEHGVNLGLRDLCCRMLAWSRTKSSISQLIGEFLNRVFARGIQLERQTN